MPNTPKIKILSFIICDDVRQEDNGKDIIIGVYKSNIELGQFPSTIPLKFWILFNSESEGEFKIKFRGIDKKTKEMYFKSEGIINVGISKVNFSANIGPVPIKFEGECHLTIESSQSGSRWKQLTTIPVNLHGQANFQRVAKDANRPSVEKP